MKDSDLIMEALEIGLDAAYDVLNAYLTDGFTAELKPRRIEAARDDITKIRHAIVILKDTHG